MSDDGERLFGRETLLLAMILFFGIIATGVIRRFLGLAGYNNLGRLVFLMGYAGMVLVVWYGWIRPLEIVGPD
jgi:hypothetical protein